jgi:regulator of protease activity HflC (stomatin/prohibitin superfamily)
MTEFALLFLAILLAAALIAPRVILTCTIHEFERGLLFRRGRFAEVLEPGRYTFLKPYATIERVDVRPRYTVIPGQEVLSNNAAQMIDRNPNLLQLRLLPSDDT